jgi:hypothetical protein
VSPAETAAARLAALAGNIPEPVTEALIEFAKLVLSKAGKEDLSRAAEKAAVIAAFDAALDAS